MTVTINGNGTITGIAEGGLPANTVTTATIKNDAVDGDKIADNAITAAHIAPDTIVAADIAANSIGSSELADDAVGSAQIADDAVIAAAIADDAIVAASIADDAVVQAAIADEAVDEARLQISNAGSNGQYLQKQSGNTGGLTWATVDTSTLLPLAGGTMTGDLLLDNEQELRLGEADGNGANYVGFKAPAALSGDKIWTLPSADGSANQVIQTNGSGVLSFATPAGGKIKQVRFTNSNNSGSTNDTSYVDCGCQSELACSSSSNYIFVSAIVRWGISASTSSYEGRPSHSLKFKFLYSLDSGSNWTTIKEFGSWADGGQGAHWAATSGNNILHNLRGTFSFQWRIHPNSTNTCQVKGQIAGGLENSNVSSGGNNQSNTMTLMELDGTGY